MESFHTLALSLFGASLILTTRSSITSFAFDQPVVSSVLLLASCGISAVVLGHWLGKRESSHSTSLSGNGYKSVPLHDIGVPHSSPQASPTRFENPGYPSSLRKVRLYSLALIVALLLRVELFRRIVDRAQCANAGYDAFLPLSFALLDWWSRTRPQLSSDEHDDLDLGVYDVLMRRLTRSRHRYVLLSLLYGIASTIALRADSAPRSTYICSSTTLDQITPFLQLVETFLNTIAIYCVSQLLRMDEGRGPRPQRLRFQTVGYSMLLSSCVWLFIGVIWCMADGNARQVLQNIPGLYFSAVIRLDIFVSASVTLALLFIYHCGAMTTIMVASFLYTATTTTIYAWSNVHPFPPSSAGYGFVAMMTVCLVFLVYLKLDAAHEDARADRQSPLFRRVPTTVYLLSVAFIILRFCLWFSATSGVTYHPVDMLIWDAQHQHDSLVNISKSSNSVEQAQDNYRHGYKRNPPPGFDKWYSYAVARNSQIIDTFDSIERDLLPFYSLSPQEIRERTWSVLADPHNDVAGIGIRSGKATLMENVRDDHRWMMEGIERMINNFAEHLPDMDLAFNINDEPRVVVPYEELPAQEVLMKQSKSSMTSFTSDRASQWRPMPENPSTSSNMVHKSWRRIFYHSGNQGCPPGSAARDLRLWNVGQFCTSCAYPHSLGAFLSDWQAAGNICHQPDLASLHGFYMSPAAFQVAHNLLPIFSQSKTFGFNDILYPSPWNYLDKVKYDPTEESPDPPFREKNTTLFWRGATSEGVSFGGGKWRGFSRERFVHMANNPFNTSPYEPLLIPYSDAVQNATGQVYRYENVPAQDLTGLLPTDMHIVERIWRCDNRDCTNQETDFAPLMPPTDFQNHWQKKYLLDLDGAGFSGRFLPFLESRSLPFKSALFREWWDDRLTAWQHFVPLDLRGQGFWATLAYFAGLDGKVNGREVKLEAHDIQAERIAEEGRKWAGKVLRKEDMEIYFFRLLIEWGRLTDDKRDDPGPGVSS